MQVAALITVFALAAAAVSYLLTDQVQASILAFIAGMFVGMGVAWVCWPWETNENSK